MGLSIREGRKVWKNTVYTPNHTQRPTMDLNASMESWRPAGKVISPGSGGSNPMAQQMEIGSSKQQSPGVNPNMLIVTSYLSTAFSPKISPTPNIRPSRIIGEGCNISPTRKISPSEVHEKTVVRFVGQSYWYGVQCVSPCDGIREYCISSRR